VTLASSLTDTHERALALFTAGQQRDALVLLFESLGHAPAAERASPAMAPLRRLVGSLLEGVAISVANDTVLGVLASVADDDAVPSQLLAPTLLALLTASEAAAALRSPAASVVTDGARDLAAHPLVPLVLPHIVVGSREGEALCTQWRHALMQRAIDPAFLAQQWLWNGIAWLGAAAFNGEYVWPESTGESALVDAMAEALAAALAHPAPPVALAPVFLTFAMYRRLSTLSGWQVLATVPDAAWGDFAPTMTPLLQRQVHAPLDEAQRAAAIPQLVVTSDAGSARVQAQYESHPYPRWITRPTARVTSIADIAREWRPHVPPPSGNDVLIAGCGTGRQAVHLAVSLPGANITAFDLSRASLGYASRMLDALQLHSVQLYQGDILALDALDTQYALISCSGVLHHLVDPRAGWQQLVHRLAPRGLLKIGVYSTTARASVRAARAVIARDALPTTDSALRSARQQLLALPLTHPAAPALDSLDSYALSGFRDLVAHVQERTYTMAELAAELDALDLEFLGFQLSRDVQQRFAAEHPHAGAARDLAAWAAFEDRHPLTFWGMYQFWCARRA
jgi:ubiquinone/menaquinone biosynthesis C-methylase UbiE